MTDLLLKITIFLLAAIMVVPLAKFLRLGSVLGYLVAGVIIGPFVLGFLGSSEQSSLQHVSEFGVVMMLFLIGLELKPSFLWKLRVPILGMGGLQILLTTIAIAGIAILFDQRWRPALAIGMILALSSTAIIIQTLSEKGLLGTKAGRSAFSVLLFQDISVIPILAILPLLAFFSIDATGHGEGSPIGEWLLHQPGYVRFSAILGAVAIIVVVGRFLSERLFRLIAATGIRDIFTAVALFIVVGVALMMESVGLSAALGTFLAGVMLADSEYRHEIELSIEPFKGLLLGLFFMSVGSSIDFKLLIDNPTRVAILVVLLIVVKFIVLFSLAKMFQHKNMQALLFACVMAQGGEFAFVLFSFAENNYILPRATATLLTLVVTLSMLITPLLMILYDLLAKKVAKYNMRRSNEEMDDIHESNPVIIAGYGRFNQIIGRLLRANGYECTVLDNNPNVIATLKRFGQKVYYGDATRPDLLQAAGAQNAKLLVIGLRDPEQSTLMIEMVRKYFPHLKIIARASDRLNAYKLMELKVDHFQREMFLSALELGEKTLIELGQHPHTAHRQARIFKEHDEKMLLELYQAWKEDPHLEQGQQPGEQYISKTRAMSESFAAVLRNDRIANALMVEHDHAWESAPTETELMERAIQEEMLAERARVEVEKMVAAAQIVQVAASIEKATEAAQKNESFCEEQKDTGSI
ncbi:monovalent cation:proton antiporter-2 (CPA2) family protein [Suttonella ornithocola]|uniref:K(+)/H(+) antiporter n=1 Tax=Suttonella ornithocola TaxID=279832 RepID=A0A380MNE0_9GAMM|nr:monovalent cation:proton antiporter-2 (CPA2) family protein [Suttonella ornithocola]SUO93413.1 K(+)/H(+) antiporter [Suttonella ornithocola]